MQLVLGSGFRAEGWQGSWEKRASILGSKKRNDTVPSGQTYLTLGEVSVPGHKTGTCMLINWRPSLHPNLEVPQIPTDFTGK